MHDRPHDVVLLGATGFTGRLTAAHLAARLAGSSRSWAVAGRDRRKLEELAAGLPGTPSTETVDVTDPDALRRLAAGTRVLVSTVGPFARLGEPVVAACIAAGTDYADITGEPAFVGDLLERHDRDARRRGVKIVNACGFDSVPYDLGVRFTVSALPDDAPTTVRGYVRATGGLSGGTLHSAVDALGDRSRPRLPSPGRDDVREVHGLRRGIHRVRELGAYGVPLPTIDPLVVLRSARVLDGYGSRFRYGHYAQVQRLPTVVAGVAMVGAGTALAAFGPSRSLLRRVLPAPGEGPDEATRSRGRFAVTFFGEAGGEEVVARVSGGDPGYTETARMLGEAALALAYDEGREVAGVLTPAVALGTGYQDRLVEVGIRFEHLEAP